MVNNAKMIDVHTLIQAGIDPKTGLPIKLELGCESTLKSDIKKLLRILDEQNAINRYKWYNLPDGLTGQMIERILYYKGQAMFFYVKELNQFFFLPYALDGSIDIYGRYTGVRPLPFNGSTEIKKEDKLEPIAKYITSIKREPIYDIYLEELTEDVMDTKCVLLSDYSRQISQINISRQILQDPLLDVMADCVPFLRTALLNSTGVQGMRVTSQDEYANVKLASAAIDNAALNSQKYVPVVGQVDFQDLAAGQVAKSEEFLLTMQSLDNLRLSFYGLDNGGLFQKKSHVLEAEQEMNTGNCGLIYQDGLTLREEFCDMVNSITGLGIWCEASEVVIGLDTNMDGIVSDEQDQTGSMPGDQPSQEGV